MNNTLKSMASAGFAILLGMIMINNTAIAMTPDGETPANEGVCDVLIGATPGLFGLCNAYCEAQDLDLVGDKEPPNSKILANYRKKMMAGDPDMPCVAAPCPCWSENEIQDLAASGTALCQTSASIGVIRNASIFAQIDLGRPLCRYNDRTTGEQRYNADFTADEAQICYDIVTAACAGL